MNRRLVATFAASAVLLVGMLPATAAAAGPVKTIDKSAYGKIDPTFRPFLADASRPVTVVLEMSGAAALTVPGLDAVGKRDHAKTLRTAQGALDGGIKAAGGKVLARYQYSYDGIKVRAAGAKLAQLAALPGVVAVRSLRTFTRDNVNGVPYIGAPSAWQYSGATGVGQTVAVIDTGLDYTHANFGGSGDPQAYIDNNSTVIEAGSFPTAKVVGGYDFAGDNYDAEGDLGPTTPTPDPDPLDCGAHGTHVAGTIAGFGVKADHSTYTGTYDAATMANPADFVVAPGVAPEAKLVSLKVFGCEGSTDLVVDALEWVAAYNVANGNAIGVVNMSLGSSYGQADSADAVATDNLVATGVVVVASAGNSNAVPFITGAPATATSAISVAALDAFPQIPGATVSLPGPVVVNGINQNAHPGLPVSGDLAVIAGPNDTVHAGLSLGCNAADYGDVTGKIAVIRRGDCVFVQKGAAAQEAGAIGVIVVNRLDTPDGALPTFLGYNPEEFTIPMIGVAKGSAADLIAADGAAATLAGSGSQPNPTYQKIADFSSSGPRWGDNWLKPDVSAPGVNILSSLNGSGWNGTTYSGTSMAAPMTAGAAALVREAHPSWSPLKVKGALSSTSDASTAKILSYSPLRAGAGVIQVDKAVATNTFATTSDKTASLSFGYEAPTGAYSETKTITITNTGDTDARYTLAASSALVSVSPATVRVRRHSSETIRVRASLTRAQVAALPTVDVFLTGAFGSLYTMSGAVTATPVTPAAGVSTLRVPYLLVPRGASDVQAELGHSNRVGDTVTTSLRLHNDAAHTGYADVYALGLTDPRGDGLDGTDIRSIGVQAIPVEYVVGGDPNPSDVGIQFAVNMWDRFSTAAPHEVDIAVDTNGDTFTDYYVISYDSGSMFAGAYNDKIFTFIFDSSWGFVDYWYADAPTNGSTIILQLPASEIGVTASSGPISYYAAAWDGFTGVADFTVDSAPFSPFSPAQTTGDFVGVASGAHVSIPASYQQHQGVLGWMVVTLDDRNGAAQADLVRVGH
jgi:subtilisin family serine protease